ncbi:MAG: O-antigen ligase family protein, partial [Deltaproteobacteria bacterium]
MVSRFSFYKKTFVTLIFGDRGMAYFWQARLLPRWLPLLLGLALGVFLAFLIANEAWPFPILVAFLVPGIILFTRYPFIAVLVWMLVFPFIVRAPGVAGRYIYWLLHRAVIPVALGSVILSDWLGVKKRREPVRLGAPELALVIFSALVFANILVFSDNPAPKLLNLYDRSLVPICMYLLVRLLAPTEKDLKRFLWVALFTVLIQSAIGLLSWFAPQTLPRFWLQKAGARTVGTFGNPAVYSSTLIFLSLLLLQHALVSRSRRQRYVLFSVVAMAFFCVFFTFSRGSWLGGSVVVLALMLLYPKVIIRLMIVVIPLIVLLSSSVLADSVAWAWERLNKEETAEGRIIGYGASIQMIQEKPLFGWGYG